MSVSLYGIASYVQATKANSLTSSRPVNGVKQESGSSASRRNFDTVEISAEGRAAMEASKGASAQGLAKTQSTPSTPRDTYTPSSFSVTGSAGYGAIEENQEDLISSAMVELISGAGF